MKRTPDQIGNLASGPDPGVVAPAELARAAGAEECRVEVDGIGIRYLRAGAGPPLLLIHGLLGFSYSWRKNMAALSRVATVYAPDLPGTGYSDRAEYDCSFAGTARLLARFLDALQIESADVIASSHGGAVATMLAALERQRSEASGAGRVRRMVLVAPVNPYSPAGRKRIALLSSRVGGLVLLRGAGVLQATRGFFLRRLYGDPRRVAPGTAEAYAAPVGIPGSMAHLLAILRNWRSDLEQLRAALPTIGDVPTLLLWGSRDGAVPLASAAPLQRHFRQARLVVLEGAGHLPYEEVPEPFNAAVLEFLAAPHR